jgi:hypothetical protein
MPALVRKHADVIEAGLFGQLARATAKLFPLALR